MIHRAGPWIEGAQHCTECGELLADCDRDSGQSVTDKRVPYPVGALVEITRTYRSMTLVDRLPNCTLKVGNL